MNVVAPIELACVQNPAHKASQLRPCAPSHYMTEKTQGPLAETSVLCWCTVCTMPQCNSRAIIGFLTCVPRRSDLQCPPSFPPECSGVLICDAMCAQVLGQKRKHLSGFSSATQELHQGFVYGCDVIQNTPPALRAKAARMVGGKCTLLARIDAYGQDPSGSAGAAMKVRVDRFRSAVAGKGGLWSLPFISAKGQQRALTQRSSF